MPLYALTPRTADRLRQLIADGGDVGGRATSGSAARGTTWVKVTGPAAGGWYPGVVSLDAGGAFEDLTAAVQVGPSTDELLATGQRYQCTRTGDAADGTARFRTAPAEAGVWEARLTEATGAADWWERALDPLGDWDDYSLAVSGTDNAYAVELDGGVFLSKPDAKVVMWRSRRNPGTFEFLPVQAADLAAGVYYPGYWNTADGQVFKGNKELHGQWSSWDSFGLVVSSTIGSGPNEASAGFNVEDEETSPGSGLHRGVLRFWSSRGTGGGFNSPAICEGAPGQPGYVRVGTNDDLQVFDYGWEIVGTGFVSHNYRRGLFAETGGYAGPFKIANGVIVDTRKSRNILGGGYTNDLPLGTLLYFDPAAGPGVPDPTGATLTGNWLVFESPAFDHVQRFLSITDGVLGWALPPGAPSGGTTGMTFTGGVMAGTLNVANGGTGATTAAGAWAAISPSTLSGARP